MNTITLNPVDRARRAVLALMATVIALLAIGTGSAFAAGDVAHRYITVGDCNVHARLYQDSGYVIGGGIAYCTRAKSSMHIYVTLKRNGSGFFPPAPRGVSNTTSTGWLWTPWARAGCQNWQTVVQYNISGLPQGYVTTGSPRVVC